MYFLNKYGPAGRSAVSGAAARPAGPLGPDAVAHHLHVSPGFRPSSWSRPSGCCQAARRRQQRLRPELPFRAADAAARPPRRHHRRRGVRRGGAGRLLQPGADSSTIGSMASASGRCPRVYARPIEIRSGQTFTQQDLIARLNDIGYAQRPDVAQPGEFAIKANEIAITPRSGDLQGQAGARAVPRRCRGKPPRGAAPRHPGHRGGSATAAPTASSSIGRC